MLEHIINSKMEKEEKEQEIKINYNQIGFKKNVGCEVNVLKLVQ